MPSQSYTVKMGQNPVVTVTGTVNSSINSSGTVTFNVNYRLVPLSGTQYWGFGVVLQYRTYKYNPSKSVNEYSSWYTGREIVTPSTSRWNEINGSLSAINVSGCNADTNAGIQLRLIDSGPIVGAGSAVTCGVDVVTCKVAAGTNVTSVSKTPNQTYHIAGDTVKVSCVLPTITGYSIKFAKWTSSNTSATPNSTSQTYSFTISDAETVTLTASATKTALASTLTSVTNVTIGNATTAKFTPLASTYYYELVVSGANSGETITTGLFRPGVTTEYTKTLNIPTSIVTSWASLSKTASLSCTATLKTYTTSATSSLVGTSSKTITLTVPNTSDYIPSFNSYSVSPFSTNATVNGWGLYVQGYTRPRFNTTATAGSGSTISQYIISGDYGATVTTTGALNKDGTEVSKVGTNNYTITVKDARGRSKAVNLPSVTVLPYYKPLIENFSLYRNADDQTQIIAEVDVDYSLVTSGEQDYNGITATVKYKKAGDVLFETLETFTNQSSFIATLNDSDESVGYDFVIEIVDTIGNTATSTKFVSTATVLMDFKHGGKGLAVGKMSEIDECFEVNGEWLTKLGDLEVAGSFGASEVEVETAKIGDAEITGTLNLTNTTDASGTANNSCPLKIGVDTGTHLEFDNNEILAKNNATTPGSLFLQIDGGSVTIGSSTTSVDTSIHGTTYIWEDLHLTGQLSTAGKGGTYIRARDNAIVKNTSSNTGSYFPIFSSKTPTGSWSAGVYQETFRITYDTDTNYNAGTNTVNSYSFDTSGNYSGKAANVTGTVAIANGGTGATSALNARSNLGITCTQIYSGTLTTGSTTLNNAYTNYKAILVVGQPTSTASRCCVFIPKAVMTTSKVHYQFADESSYYSFDVNYSGANVAIAYQGRNSSGQIIRVYGVN